MPESTLKFAELGAAVVVAVLVSLVRALVVQHRSWQVAVAGFITGAILGVSVAIIAHGYGASAGTIGLIAGVSALGGRDLVLGVVDEFKLFREDREGFVRKWLAVFRGNFTGGGS